MKKKIFVCIFLITLILGILSAKAPETNLLNAVLSNSSSDLINITNKFSSKINVIFEADNIERAESLKYEFLSKVNKDLIPEYNYEALFNDYKSSPNNFLSAEMRELIKKKDYDKIITFAEESLYNPVSFGILPIYQDPFFLFSNFIQNLQSYTPQYKSHLGDKYYSVLNLEIDKHTALSPDTANMKVEKLIKLKNELSSNSEKIYLTGSPIHSYVASSRSITEINIIVVISMMFILYVTYYYFGTLKVLIPIIISILCGIISGYSLTALIFKHIHILTFVFSTTLIGICIDYSLHYFIENNIEKLSKSLTASLLTTVAAFLVLIFSNVPLLKQIAVFTSTGLITVYFIVILFYPLFNFNFKPKKNIPHFNIKNKKILCSVFVILVIIGLCKVKFSDNLKSMYKPNKQLANAEKIYNQLNLSTEKMFLTVKGKSIQDILKTEEKIADKLNGRTMLALSSFVPSDTRQIENQNLIEELYVNKLYDYAKFLTQPQKMELLKNKELQIITVNFDKYPYLKEFLLNENTSIVSFSGVLPSNFSEKNVKIINPAEDISKELSNHRKTCLLLVVVAFVTLFLFLNFNYKQKTLTVLTPSIIGILTAFSALGLSNQPVTLFHLFAMFLILGFTLDYSIFRVSEIQNSEKAVFISSLTTVVSFLLLSFTSFKLISSFGFVLAVGISTAYLFSLVLIRKEVK